MLLPRLPDFLKKVSLFGFEVIKQFYTRQALIRSASLAYTTLLAIVPLSIIIINVVSFFPIFDRFISEIEGFIFTNFVPHTGNAILQVLQDFQQQSHNLPWMSFIFLFITSMLMLNTMESHMNELWGITKRRFFGITLLIHWLILTIGPLLLCASLFLSSYFFSNRWFESPIFLRLGFFFPFFCSFLAYTFLYFTMPNCKVKFKHAMIGAFIAALFFEYAKVGFAIYTSLVPTYAILYGALAVIPLFLLWLYLSSAIFLLGGQVVNVLRIQELEKTTAEEHPSRQQAHK